jgi:hypothetical protein
MGKADPPCQHETYTCIGLVLLERKEMLDLKGKSVASGPWSPSHREELSK